MAAGDAKGEIYFISRREDDTWEHFKQQAHDGGVNAVSWAPATSPDMFGSDMNSEDFKLPKKRLVSGGIDSELKVWEDMDSNEFKVINTLKKHSGWVRDVAWCNNIGLTQNIIASCSEDGKALIWKLTG